MIGRVRAPRRSWARYPHRVRAIAWILVCSAAAAPGCAQLLGLDPTSQGGEPDAGVDPSLLTFRFVVREINGQVTDAPGELELDQSYVHIRDAAEPGGWRRAPLALASAGVYTAQVPPGADFSVVWDPPYDDGIVRVTTLPARDQTWYFNILGRRDEAPPLPTSTLAFNLTLDTPYAGEALQVYTLGAWAARGLDAPPLGATTMTPAPFAAESLSSISGRPLANLVGSRGDAMTVLRYVGNKLRGALTVPSFDVVDGENVVTGTLLTVADAPINLNLGDDSPATRLPAVVPAPTSAITTSWSVNAAPAAALASNSGPQLAANEPPITGPGPLVSAHGNPFPWPAVLTYQYYASRTHTPPGLAAVASSTGMYVVADQLGTADVAQDLSIDVPLPVAITAAGTTLTIDGRVVTADLSQPIEVTYTTDRTGADYYSLAVYALEDRAGATAYVTKVSMGQVASVGPPRFVIPGGLLQVGVPYILRANVARGFPNMPAGDTKPVLPYRVGYLDAGSVIFQ